MNFDLGVYNFHCRHPDESIKHFERTNELNPTFYAPRFMIAWDYLLKGEYDRAAHQCDTVFEEVGQNFDSFLVGSCACVYVHAGRTELARQLLEQLRSPPAGIRVDPITISWVCFELKDLECGFEQLEESLRQRSSIMIFLRTAPVFDPFRDHPRFRAIMEQMDFPS
jgi:hypothetical protein